MNSQDKLQKVFLEAVKLKFNGGGNFADTLADLLHISKDSAYRRIRGETPLHFDEIQKLSIHFNVSVDQMLSLNTSVVSFINRNIRYGEFSLKQYLKSIMDAMDEVLAYNKKQMIYAAKDIPVFNLFQFKELTNFKLYFWLQNLEVSPDFKDVKYDPDKISDELFQMTSAVWERYMKIPSIELWSDESININLRHIGYYFESGYLSKEAARRILEEVKEMVAHVKLQAELSKKFYRGKPETGIENSLQLYYNEVSISDNTIYYTLDDSSAAIITYNLMNTLTTSNEEFCRHVHDHLQTIIKKSSLISSVSEKTRNKVFNHIEEKIAQLDKQFS